jgi:hypothetical protein
MESVKGLFKRPELKVRRKEKRGKRKVDEGRLATLECRRKARQD